MTATITPEQLELHANGVKLDLSGADLRSVLEAAE